MKIENVLKMEKWLLAVLIGAAVVFTPFMLFAEPIGLRQQDGTVLCRERSEYHKIDPDSNVDISNPNNISDIKVVNGKTVVTANYIETYPHGVTVPRGALWVLDRHGDLEWELDQEGETIQVIYDVTIGSFGLSERTDEKVICCVWRDLDFGHVYLSIYSLDGRMLFKQDLSDLGIPFDDPRVVFMEDIDKSIEGKEICIAYDKKITIVGWRINTAEAREELVPINVDLSNLINDMDSIRTAGSGDINNNGHAEIILVTYFGRVIAVRLDPFSLSLRRNHYVIDAIGLDGLEGIVVNVPERHYGIVKPGRSNLAIVDLNTDGIYECVVLNGAEGYIIGLIEDKDFPTGEALAILGKFYLTRHEDIEIDPLNQVVIPGNFLENPTLEFLVLSAQGISVFGYFDQINRWSLEHLEEYETVPQVLDAITADIDSNSLSDLVLSLSTEDGGYYTLLLRNTSDINSVSFDELTYITADSSNIVSSDVNMNGELDLIFNETGSAVKAFEIEEGDADFISWHHTAANIRNTRCLPAIGSILDEDGDISAAASKTDLKEEELISKEESITKEWWTISYDTNVSEGDLLKK